MKRTIFAIPVLLLGAGLIGIVVFLVWSIGLGWLLTKIFGFTLFEGSLLAMFSSVSVGYVLVRLLAITPPDFDFDDNDSAIKALHADIPMSRFVKSEANKTLEAWFSYSLANNVYLELQQNPRLSAQMDPPHLQELSIRLSEIIVKLLKRKPIRKKKVRITLADLREQMTLMDQKPYDDDILTLAVGAANMLLSISSAENVVRQKLWDRHTDMFDMIE
jgi:hypothetical protein